MKTSKILSSLLVISLLFISCSREELTDTSNQETNLYHKYTSGDGPFVHFEDIGFKEVLLNNFNINTNKDNEISLKEAKVFKGAIDVSFKGIGSLAGIEKFENLKGLDCANNNLYSIDVSKLLELEFLSGGNNPIEDINLSFNIKLTHLDIRTTQISNLDLYANINLVVVRGMCNPNLKTVNIRNNNNSKILVFFFDYQNPNLECVQVDDVNFSKGAPNWFIPSTAYYSESCIDS